MATLQKKPDIELRTNSRAGNKNQCTKRPGSKLLGIPNAVLRNIPSPDEVKISS